MAPMIDVVFHVLIFFMLNLKIISPEGEFDIHLPPSTQAQGEAALATIKVGLHSDRDGNLTWPTLGANNLGNDNAAFERLNSENLKIIGRPGNPLAKEIEVELDADFECQYKYIVKAISRCTGRHDPRTKQVARYLEKIRFAPPQKPKV